MNNAITAETLINALNAARGRIRVQTVDGVRYFSAVSTRDGNVFLEIAHATVDGYTAKMAKFDLNFYVGEKTINTDAKVFFGDMIYNDITSVITAVTVAANGAISLTAERI